MRKLIFWTLSKMWKKVYLNFLVLSIILTIAISQAAYGQNRTITSAGNWSNTGIWGGGNRADVVGETVTVNDNLGGTGLVTVNASFTVGTMDTGDNNDFTISNGFTLNIGDDDNSDDLTVGNNTVITVNQNGDLIIWGDLIIPDDTELSLTIAVGATVVIHGSLVVNDNSGLTISGSGSFEVLGDMEIPDNGELSLTVNGPGTVSVSDIEANDNSVLTVSGAGDFDLTDDINIPDDGELTITANGPGTITVDNDINPGDDSSLTINGNGSVDVSGDLILQDEDDLTLTVNGTLDVDDIDVSGNSTLVVNGTGTVTAQDDLTAGDNAVIEVNGSLTIGDDLVADDDLNVFINNGGVVHVGDDFVVDDDFDLDVDSGGQLVIDDDFIGDDNVDFQDIDGSVVIGDNLEIDEDDDSGSVVQGTGPVTVGGDCNGPDAFCQDAQLPVVLVNFKALTEGEVVNLEWMTLMEKNFQKFVIERSSNGIDFSNLGELPGAGFDIHEIETKYEFIDPMPLNGLNYYRLKAVDLDGTSETFDVVAVNYSGVKTFHIYSNPSDGKSIAFKTNFEPNESDRIIILDRLGAEHVNIPVTANQNEIQMVNPLSTGVYLVKYTGDGIVKITRLIVR